MYDPAHGFLEYTYHQEDGTKILVSGKEGDVNAALAELEVWLETDSDPTEWANSATSKFGVDVDFV